MLPLWISVQFLILAALVCSQEEEPVLPRSINFHTPEVIAANGSSLFGNCSKTTFNPDRTTTCNNPASSVLMDGKIPSLSGLRGDTWAEQLVILNGQNSLNSSSIYFNFSDGGQIGRVEVTLFNCIAWRAAIDYFEVFDTSGESIAMPLAAGNTTTTISSSVSSCDSLIKLCVPVISSPNSIQRLEFTRLTESDTIHLAEIGFFRNSEPCPYLVIPEVSQESEESDNFPTDSDEVPGVQVEISGSSATQVVLSFLAIVTALQTTVILIVVIFVAHKYRQSLGVASRASKRVEYAYEIMNPVSEDPSKTPKVSSHDTTAKKPMKEPTHTNKTVCYTKPQHQ